MFFEGPEKKFELITRTGSPDLRQQAELWPALIDRAKTTVLSEMQTDHCTAYLLSESSLFVFQIVWL
jgi:S-adenosylmethionine decarboxylase